MKIAFTFAAVLLFAASTATAKCVDYTEADGKIGSSVCVTGKVVKVAQSASGTFYLNFCEKYRNCPFTVVVFPSSLKNVGDVRPLEGQMIEIFGKVTRWQGHAEIILRDARQLKGEAAKLPPVPKEFDVEKKGKFSSTAPSTKKDKSQQQ